MTPRPERILPYSWGWNGRRWVVMRDGKTYLDECFRWEARWRCWMAEHLELAGYHRVGNQWAGPDLHFSGRTHERLPQSLTAAAAEVIRHESRSTK